MKNLKHRKKCCECPPEDIQPPVTLTKTVDLSTVTVGQLVTFTITATNSGSIPIPNVTIADFLPLGFSLVSASPGCTVQGQAVVCNFSFLPVGNTIITITARPTLPGSFINSSTLTFNQDPSIQPLIALVSVNVLAIPPPPPPPPVQLLLINKVAEPQFVVVGQVIQFTITLSNPGPDPINNIILTDPIPTTFPVSFISSGCIVTGVNTVICNIGTLSPGMSTVVILQVTPRAGASGTFTNIVTATYTINGVNGTVNASATVTVA